MKKYLISYLTMIIALILIAIGKYISVKNNISFLAILLFIIGFIILVYGINEFVKLVKGKGLIDHIKGEKYELLLLISTCIVLVGIIFNIINIKMIGVPISILGIGLLFYSNELEREYKERKLKEKITEKLKENKKVIEKKVNKTKNNYKKYKKKHKKR